MPLVNLDGVDIYYEEHGSGPVTYVYCHGLGGNSKFFEQRELDWYKDRFRVITWDNRGLGRSGIAEEYSLPLYAKDLKLLLDYLAVDQAVLFGVSWGGVVVQRFALDYPEKCRALILDSTSSETNIAGSENWYMRGEIARIGRDAALQGRELESAFAGHSRAGDNKIILEKDSYLASYIAQCRSTAGLREHPLTPELNRLTMPILVIGGGKDVVAGAGGSVIIARSVPNSTINIFQEACHGVYISDRIGFKRVLLDFLDQEEIL
ncbi:MAG: alpha/beta hydrolase [Dehalococcoidia bacterium]|nr:alpha/beta hydrolase [Dehalococcoidia bacterium]